MTNSMDPSNFDFATEEGKSKFYMTAQAELYFCLDRLETSMPEVSTIIHSIDLQLSEPELLKNINNILYQYIHSLQTFHLYYQEILKIRDIETPKYYQKDLYPS